MHMYASVKPRKAKACVGMAKSKKMKSLTLRIPIYMHGLLRAIVNGTALLARQ